MEISIDNIIAIITLFIGSGGGAFFTWRYQRRKAKAEAKLAEAEAEKTKLETTQANTQLIKDIQNSYQRLAEDLKTNLDTQQEYNSEQKQYIAELKEDRMHLRRDRDDLRKRQDELEEQVRGLQREVARNGRMVANMRPFLCGFLACKNRTPVTISEDGEAETETNPQTS